jgi:lipoprotein NlpD
MTRNSGTIARNFNAAMKGIRRAINAEILFAMSIFTLGACGGHVYHLVERGETLYSIGWMYGYDYRQVAQWNGIESPYYLHPGQRLRVAPPVEGSTAPLQEYRPAKTSRAPAPVVEAVKKSAPAKAEKRVRTPASSATVVAKAKATVEKRFHYQTPRWRWPVRDVRILRTFSSRDPARQGLDIAGELDAPVYASAAGRVVYAGSGLVRYGQLIIVKHNEKYLSAYAHNHKLHVREGDAVKAGQQIAGMGRTGASRVKLHFEIRRNGKPVDPLRYLPRQK